MKITVIGTVFVDIKGYPRETFVPASGRNAGDIVYCQGGVARNVAEDAAVILNSLGASAQDSVSFIGLVDPTSAGTDVVKHLQSVGVDTSFVKAVSGGMGTWLAVFDNDGEVYANMSQRPDLRPIKDILLENEDQIFEEGSSVLLEIDIDPEVVETVFSLAKKHGCKVYSVISNSTVARERMPFILRSECFICNRAEAKELFGVDFTENDKEEGLDDLKLLRAMLRLPSVVVTLDSEGAAYVSGSECGLCPAVQTTVLDTTGAGDSFFAAVSVMLSRGSSLAEACAFGAKVAAKVISRKENVYTV